MSAFPQQQTPPTPIRSEASYSEKQFLHTQTVAVVVPLMQSAVTGLIVFIVCVVMAFKFNAMDVLSVPLVFGVLAFGATWFLHQRRWITLTNLERMLGKDLNGDGSVGTPKQVTAPTVIRIEHIEKGRYRSRDIKLSADEQALTLLAIGLTNGKRFSEKEWTPESKGFSTEGFRQLRSDMLKYGLIELKNEAEPRQGFRLTEDGEEWRKRYVIPSPIEDEDGA